MRRISRLHVIIAAIVVALVAFSSVYVVDETESAIEIRLGTALRVIEEPGLYIRTPFITNVWKIDRRLRTHDIPPGSIITEDKKTMLVDNYAQWRVVDPLLFYQTVRTMAGAQSRLEDVVYSQVREILGHYTLAQIVSDERADLMVRVTENTQREVGEFGMDMRDVRIKRADLPDENSQAVFGRMQAERHRIAKRYRSEGEEEALRIRSDADRQKAEVLATAEQEAQMIRGDADAEAAAIYAAAYSQDEEFFRFMRSNEAYRKTLANGTTVVLSEQDQSFLEYFK